MAFSNSKHYLEVIKVIIVLEKKKFLNRDKINHLKFFT